jgi:hypothetical protein
MCSSRTGRSRLNQRSRLANCLTNLRAAISSAWAAIPLRTKRPTYFRPGDWTVLRPITLRRPCQGGLPVERLFPRICQRPFGLEDQELDWLLRVAADETKRRGRPMPMAEASPTNTLAASSEQLSKQTKQPGRPIHQRHIGPPATPLTKGQVNAVRAAFKAGVTPSRIARQFGLSHSDVRKALSSGERKR